MRDDRQRLLDILDAIGNIERRIPESREAFADDELVQVWVVHHIQIIGEAAASLSQAFRDRYPAVPWGDIVSMRNVLVHQYFGIDLDEVWSTVVTDLPRLRRGIEGLLTDDEPAP
jgi:uncharacterized protein with HEPN domain